MKNIFYITMLTLMGFCHGCANYSEKIVFASEQGAQLTSVTPVLPPSLSDAERAQVEAEVFRRLLAGHFGDDGDYSAIFLQADETLTARLMKEFPKHQPPIKQLWHSDIHPDSTPQDKDTGRAAMIFSVETTDPENDSVTAIGRWYAGDAVKGFYSYNFKRTDAGWELAVDK